MRHLADVIRQPLRWMQVSALARTYQLRSGSDLVATLSFRSAWGTLAHARSADGSWTFKRVGFWQTRATVREDGAPCDLATFEHKTWRGGGTLRLADGRSLLVTTNFWQTHIEFRPSEDHVLFRYRTEGFLRQSAELEIMPGLAGMREAPWLLMFGWYLVVMMHQDASSTVVIA